MVISQLSLPKQSVGPLRFASVDNELNVAVYMFKTFNTIENVKYLKF